MPAGKKKIQQIFDRIEHDLSSVFHLINEYESATARNLMTSKSK